jgi:hypothetical protein
VNAVRSRLWWFLLFFAAVMVVFGVGDVLSGVTADPAIATGLTGLSLQQLQEQDPAGYRLFDFATRGLGLNLALVGVIASVILFVPYRAGARWAWYAIWVLPIWCAAVVALYLAFGLAPGAPTPPPMISGPIFGVLAAIVLLVDRPRFFSGERPQ